MRLFTRIRWIVFVVVMIILSSCSLFGGKSDIPPPISKDEQVTLKLAVQFDYLALKDYISYFNMEYPNIKIELVEWDSVLSIGAEYEEQFDQFIEAERPDLIIFRDTETFGRWAQEGYLYELDPLIQADQFDIENVSEHIVEFIKIKGGGKLFGLAPTFWNQVLFYNKTLFDEYQIEYPKNQMNWEEMISLAEQFPAYGSEQEELYGFAINEDYINLGVPFSMMKMIAESKGMSFITADYATPTFNSPEWANIFGLLVEGIQSGAIYYDPSSKGTNNTFRYPESIANSLFAIGKAAMTIDDFSFANRRLLYAEELPDVTMPDWDIVTVPVDLLLPDETNQLQVSDLFAIVSKTDHLRAAWEFVKYVNSEETSSLQSQSFYSNNRLQTRAEHSLDRSDRDLTPFYMLKPLSVDIVPLPPKFYTPLQTLLTEQLNAVLRDEKTIEEALNELQVAGETELKNALIEGDK